MKRLLSVSVIAAVLLASPITVTAHTEEQKVTGCKMVAFVARDVMYRRQSGESFDRIAQDMNTEIGMRMVNDAFQTNHLQGDHMQPVRDALISDFADFYFAGCLSQ